MSDLEHPAFDNIEERQTKWNAKQNAKNVTLFHMLKGFTRLLLLGCIWLIGIAAVLIPTS